MDNTKDIRTQQDILEGLKERFEACTTLAKSVPAEAWNLKPEGKWSAAQNLDHLIKSTKPLGMGLGLPKFAIRAQFGKPNDRPARTFGELKKRYYEKLADVPAGVTAPAGFTAAEGDIDQAELIADWEKSTAKLLKVIDKSWSDDKLNSCLFPHPLLGKLYVREMLFFTIFHTTHHMNTIQDRINLI